MEQLSELPPLALLSLGVTLAIIFAVQRFGFLSGSRATPDKSTASTVAAVIVDSTALNKATAAVEAHAAATNRLSDVGARLAEAAERKARAEEHMAIELDRIREEMRIQRELRRG